MAAAQVFYVDDDEDIRAIVEFALEDEAGVALTLCASGAEALVKAQQSPPALILLDVMMPEQDGPATLAQLRALPGTARTPVVFVTAKVQPEEVQALLALGAQDVVAKPFDALSLPARVRALLEQFAGR